MNASSPRPSAVAGLALALALSLGPAIARPAECPGPTLSSSGPAPAATPWMDPSLDPERRTELLLGEMTLEEKIDLATGERCLVYGFYNAPIDRLGIPPLTMTDGPAGIRIPHRRVNRGRATQLPAPLALWSPAAHAWHVPSCALPVLVASSSRDVRLEGALLVSADGAVAAAPAASGGGCRHEGGGPTSLLVLLAAILLRRAAGRRLLAGSGRARPARRAG